MAAGGDSRRLTMAVLAAAFFHLIVFAAGELFIKFPQEYGNSLEKTGPATLQVVFSRSERRSAPEKKKITREIFTPTTDERKKEGPREDPPPAHSLSASGAAIPYTGPAGKAARMEETGESALSAESRKTVTAGRKAAAAGQKATVHTPRVPPSSPAFTAYLQQLLEERRRYPLAARKRSIEGYVELIVEVSKKGGLRRMEISASSGSRILDRAAEDLVKKVFPVDYPVEKELSTTIRISYRLTDV
jgi:TonB family protein